MSFKNNPKQVQLGHCRPLTDFPFLLYDEVRTQQLTVFHSLQVVAGSPSNNHNSSSCTQEIMNDKNCGRLRQVKFIPQFTMYGLIDLFMNCIVLSAPRSSCRSAIGFVFLPVQPDSSTPRKQFIQPSTISRPVSRSPKWAIASDTLIRRLP